MVNSDLIDAWQDSYVNLQSGLQTQSYRVEGQRAQLLDLFAGDRLELSSIDGLQTAEILVLNAAGQPSPNALGTRPVQRATETLALLESETASAKALRSQLQMWGVEAAHLDAVLVIAGGECYRAVCQTDVQLIILAPALDMTVDEHNPGTELLVTVQRSAPSAEFLPPAIGPVEKEIRIPKASAAVYSVKAGEWIQMIDVAGKQSSDFLAFDENALKDGREIGIDATATRTVMGNSLPQPGLFSRFLDSQAQSLVEVIQDTVGRHDSFLLACTPKYYEDAGYFGHPSCTENFNRALKPYGVTPRSGWPAINFFFNTNVEAGGAVVMDEPWSRPGDFVLLRATRDLVCASSACPDDIDPANGWLPTDIHVRIYSANAKFEPATAYRVVPQELPRMTKTTGFHSAVSGLTKHLIEYRGYWVASHYTGFGKTAEYLACRERVAMIDLSPLRKFEIIGPDAESFLQYVLTRNVRRLSVGEVVYSAMCLETGGMIDDGTLFKMGEQAFRWICGDPYTGTWMIKVAREQGFRVSIRNASDQIHNVAVQGPSSRDLLKSLIWTSPCQPALESLAWFHFLIGRLGGPQGLPVMVSRTGYTGELGFEVWCHPSDGEEVWSAIWQAGQEYGIAPMGFEALDTLRIEAGLIFAEQEFCPLTNPFEAGIGFTVPLKSKEEPFIGREALSNQAPNSRKKLVGLVLAANEPAAHGDPVYHERFPIGVVTSAVASPLLKAQIALCRVAPEFSVPGTVLEIGQLDGHQKRLSGQVVTLPFYDPERKRVRS